MSNKVSIDDVKILPVRLFFNDGSLFSIEAQQTIPFEIKRVFSIFGVSANGMRGDHAHKVCKQALICLTGSCEVIYTDGFSEKSILLESPDKIVYIPAMIWAKEIYSSPETVVNVYADQHYDTKDYIQDFDKYLAVRREAK